MTLKDEIKQTKPFSNIWEETVLNVVRTSDKLDQTISHLLKEFNLSLPQYNVLRILRGAGENGWTCSDISARMIKKDSDITRLLDRLESTKLINRIRDNNDRRVIKSFITKKGLKILEKIQPHLTKVAESLMGKMGPTKMKKLIQLLEEFRLNINP